MNKGDIITLAKESHVKWKVKEKLEDNKYLIQEYAPLNLDQLKYYEFPATWTHPRTKVIQLG